MTERTKCKDCKYSYSSIECLHELECRRNPPIPMKFFMVKGFVAVWPTIHDWDWCWDGEPKHEK